jgi:flagellar hook-basal body complex protein FliE
MNISPIAPPIAIPSSPQIDGLQGSSATTGEFRDIFKSAIDQVESSRHQADQSVDQFLSGEGDDLHSTILSVQRADLEFQLALQVRNKVVSAYQEVMRMQM